MLKIIEVKLNQRVVVLRHSLPLVALGPGKHLVWGFGLTVRRWSTDELLFEALPEVRALLPDDWYNQISLAPNERGILYRDGQPQAFLRPGVHRFWTVDPSVKVTVLSVQEPLPELTEELIAILPRQEYIDVTVHAHERGLHYAAGRLVAVLAPGHYTLWSQPAGQVQVRLVDMRRVDLTIGGQELMTRDKVTLRLTLTAHYAVEDPALCTHEVVDVRDTIYLLVQLVARELVSGLTLDQLLEGRETLTEALLADVIPRAHQIGVKVFRVGLKDIVLPGEMRTLLNRVIEAEKEAAANVILRREETAATRSLANTARVMAEQPVLLRLKELESLKEIASRIGEVRVVIGADGLKTLLPAGLLDAGSNGKAAGREQ